MIISNVVCEDTDHGKIDKEPAYAKASADKAAKVRK
jgi:hypothetical protein